MPAKPARRTGMKRSFSAERKYWRLCACICRSVVCMGVCGQESWQVMRTNAQIRMNRTHGRTRCRCSANIQKGGWEAMFLLFEFIIFWRAKHMNIFEYRPSVLSVDAGPKPLTSACISTPTKESPTHAIWLKAKRRLAPGWRRLLYSHTMTTFTCYARRRVEQIKKINSSN